jgi:hypothetical protein
LGGIPNEIAHWILLCDVALLGRSVTCACTVDEAVATLRFNEIQYRGDRAKQQQIVLNGLKRINEKAKDNSRPIGEQLSSADVAEFSRLQQRFQTVQLYNLIESGYVRDARVIGVL